MVAATIAVIALDYAEMLQAPERSVQPSPGLIDRAPTKPSAEPLPSRRGGERRPGMLRTADKALGAPVTFELAGDGRLIATGTIVPGAAETLRRRDRQARRLCEDGGAAFAGRLGAGCAPDRPADPGAEIQHRGARTARYCASSCPLIFAGGVERIAGAEGGDRRASGLRADAMPRARPWPTA